MKKEEVAEVLICPGISLRSGTGGLLEPYGSPAVTASNFIPVMCCPAHCGPAIGSTSWRLPSTGIGHKNARKRAKQVHQGRETRSGVRSVVATNGVRRCLGQAG